MTWRAMSDCPCHVAKVDGPKQKALAKRLHITAYPTIIYLRDGEMRVYSDARGLSQLAAFGRKAWGSLSH